MRHSSIRFVAFIAFIAGGLFSFSAHAAEERPPARVEEKERIVEASPPPAQPWVPAVVGKGLLLREKVRTGELSRATVRLSNEHLLRVNADSRLVILPSLIEGKPLGLELQKGEIYLHSRGLATELGLKTPVVTGTPRGTEFRVLVAADGTTTFTMFDGEVELANPHGTLRLGNNEQAIVEPGRAPRKTAMIEARSTIQWCLYYPGVLHVPELALSPTDDRILRQSLEAYQRGDLLGALDQWPGRYHAASQGGKLYRAMVVLGVGQVDEARKALAGVAKDAPGRRAIEEMIDAVNYIDRKSESEPATAGEWLARSYYEQSRARLQPALAAARKATSIAPEFGYAWTRVAELLFSFGKTQDASKALDRGIQLAPRNAQAHALRGFLLAAQNHISDARQSFDQAIALDGALANAWLGRGLTSIRRGHEQDGRRDMQIAAALEPNRSILRSYLGKAASQAGSNAKANLELDRAKKIDPNDPTPWLYSAIQRKQENRYNEAVADLEKSLDLNDNRRVYRSQFLLDQDRAVRGTNLASIYLKEGMEEQSVREAVRAVNSDYGSAAAHLFLANSYDALRDPNRVVLRYETAWFNELLISNLISPVGGGSLSQFVSQQEYSKLFEKDGVGVSSLFEYRSTGQVRENASVYGTAGNLGFAIDAGYHYDRGVRLNNSLSNTETTATFKLQLGLQDSLFFQTTFGNLSTGDVLQRYDQGEVNGVNVQVPDEAGGFTSKFVPNRFAQSYHQRERQDPGMVLLGWHHEWSPGNHTLLLLGRLATRQEFTANGVSVPTVIRDAVGRVPDGWDIDVGTAVPRDAALFSVLSPLARTGDIFSADLQNYDLDLRIKFETYTAELQQIFTFGKNSLLIGGRYQKGTFDTVATLSNYNNGTRPDEVGFFQNMPLMQSSSVAFERINLYLYDTWKVTPSLTLTAGVTYDSLAYPDNFRSPPITNTQAKIAKVSPKAGLILQPWKGATIRAAYAEGISGASFDESVRLEPTQVAGFLQATRSLASESLIGSVSGSRLRISGASLEQKLPSKLYFGVGVERREQRLDRTTGAFDLFDDFGTPLGILPSGLTERIRYREDSITASLNKLVGANWSFGARYRYTKSDLHRGLPELDAALQKSQDSGAVDGLARSANTRMISGLHELGLYAIYNCPSGFFARGEANYYRQANADYVNSATLSDPDDDGKTRAIVTTSNSGLPGDNFWQFNLLAGYRFSRNRCEVSCGVLNLANRDYHLSVVNPYEELPRERTFIVRCKLNF